MISNNQVQQFQSQHFGKLTVIRKDGEFFFIGKEVADMLGYINSRKAIGDHVDNEDKGVTKWNTLGGAQNISVINESGLYSLILSSKLPQAKEFKRWVTKEILPSIRKYGGYIQNQEEKSNDEILASAILVAQNVIKDKERKIAELEPKAIYYDNLVNQHLLTNIRNTAKELKVSQKKFVEFLLENKFLYRDKFERLLPYAKKNNGYFEIKEWYNYYNDLVGIQTLITPKGREYLMALIGGDVTCD
ncbi:MAG: phage antirepressor Ant [Tissierellia bacterium]|nr:phage antirepressor Ant [Tissierellia bacterium]